MTDLESPRKNNDCYFYYYSTCAKGDSCTFRHEPSALGCETMCSFWKEGKCLNVHCNFRHMELRKNRKAIQCYWETQPGGCLKPHCPFMHASPKPEDQDETSEKNDIGKDLSDTDDLVKEKLNNATDNFKNTPVDSLVVNFEEESDNESAPSFSPIKANRIVKVKTLEEIKLEKIQAESAAYYSYPGVDELAQEGDDLRKRILERLKQKQPQQNIIKKLTGINPEISLDETLETKLKKPKILPKINTDVKEIKVKTLAEIRAEKMRQETKSCKRKHSPISFEEAEVSSTSMDDGDQMKTTTTIEVPRKKIKLRRTADENVVTSVSPKETMEIQSTHEVTTQSETTPVDKMIEEDAAELERCPSNKTMDEVLLLEDDDDLTNVSIKCEDDLLNEIDNLLND